MKFKIRKSYFETNSSSVHAIIIPKFNNEESYDNYFIPEKIELRLRYYGWEEEYYDSIVKRFNYIFAMLVELEEYNYILKLLNFLDKFNIKLVASKNNNYDNLEIKVINALEEFKNNQNDLPLKKLIYILKDKIISGIDHGILYDEYIEEIFNDEEMLKLLLFGRTIIITGNDNDSILPIMINIIKTHQDYKVLVKGN